MNHLCVSYYNSAYDQGTGSYTNIFWSMQQSIRISSPVRYYKGDVLEVVGMGNGEVRVLPLSEQPEENQEYPVLVFMLTSVSLCEDSDYEFRSSNGVQPVLIREVVKGGNKRYMMFVSVPQKSHSILSGIDKESGTRIEFNIKVGSHG